MSLLISSHIYRHSLDVFHEHRKLLVFPLLSMLVVIACIALIVLPAWQVTAGEVWNWMWHPVREKAATHAAWDAVQQHEHDLWRLIAGIYLCGGFALTFINVAFCSQALSAMNGGGVSIVRGLSLAAIRLPAVAAWALVNSTIGAVLTLVGGILTVVGGLIQTVLGVTWEAAAQFVIPIMLNEPRNRSPLTYLQISAQVLRSAWGDGLSLGRVGPNYAGGLWIMCLLFAFGWIAVVTKLYALVLWGALVIIAIGCVMHALLGIFRCGLYIYATEGVVPGPFDVETINRAWTVGERRAGTGWIA